METVRLKRATKENFFQYGEVLTTDGRVAEGNPMSHLWYPQVMVLEGMTSLNLMQVLPHEFAIRDFERHENTTENLFAMDGDLIVGLAPVGELTKENVEAFYIPAGSGISLKPLIWHTVPFAVGRVVQSLCVFKNGTSHDDIHFASIEEPLELML